MHYKITNLGISALKQNALPMSMLRSMTSLFTGARYYSNNTPRKRSYGQFPPRKPFLPPNINFALDIIDRSQVRNSVVQVIRNAYFQAERRYMNLKNKYRRKNYPLIVLEGLDGCGKSVVGKRVALDVEAEYRSSPPKPLAKVRRHFNDVPLRVRCAFYTIGNHIVSMQMFPAISKRTIILDRFWHSTSALAIAQAAFTDLFFPLPEPDDPIYVWPRDLLRPDLVMFLHVSEENRIKRHCNRGTASTSQEQLLSNNVRFRKMVLTAFSRMRKPSLVKIDANPKVEVVVDAVQARVEKLVEEFSVRKKKIDFDDDDD